MLTCLSDAGECIVIVITSNYDGLLYFKEMRVTPLLNFLSNNDLISTVGTTGIHAVISASIKVTDIAVPKHNGNEVETMKMFM